jgi:hypothetical protein
MLPRQDFAFLRGKRAHKRKTGPSPVKTRTQAIHSIIYLSIYF